MKHRKPLDFIGSSKKDLMDLPLGIKQKIGHSLHLAQIEVDDEDTKPLKGFGSSDVREIVKSDSAGTYRAVYTVRFEEKIYVLHSFKKKSKTGIETPKQDIDLIKSRLKVAQEKYKEWKKNES